MEAAITRFEPKEVVVHTPTNVDFIPAGHKSYEVLLDNEFTLPMDKRSQVAGMLALGMDLDDLKEEFLGGRFFIVDGDVIDHRLKSNLKFEHSEDAVKELTEKLGFCKRTNLFGHGQVGMPFAHSADEAFESSILDSVGGQFDIYLGFGWSPFELDIEGTIEMIRQVCSNGAIARSPLLDRHIPMMNRWEENLHLSRHVMRHSFEKMVLPRLEALPQERASLADLNQVSRILSDYASSTRIQSDSRTALERMLELVDTASDIPGASQLQSNQLRFIEAPMTAFDAYNIVTEAATHHRGEDKHDAAANSWISGMLFNDQRKRAARADLDSLMVSTNTFADADRAFFGTTCH